MKQYLARIGLGFALAALGIGPVAAANKPNVVIILVDDAALMDFGIYGGEARTPNIDALAARGALFTQYRTSPMCSPSRAMLLTGLDSHLTGITTIPEVIPAEQKGQPGYTLHLEPGVETIAEKLRANGYRTLMAGKWHMGSGAGDLPIDHGFDKSFALDASGADNWEDKPYLPHYLEAPWYEDDQEADLPEDFYSSQFIVDKMIDYLAATDSSKPFFAYLPFQAIHLPVQAPAEFIAHYKGVYDDGWHVLREKRHQRAQELGLMPKGAPLAPMPDSARAWDSLSDEEKTLYAARMEVNAAMLEAMDYHVGRFIEHLKQTGQYDNTIFVVTSDNGPEPNRGDDLLTLTVWMWFMDYHIGLEGIGQKGSWSFIGPEWANAAASPSALYKFYAAEGGVRAPLIISGPGVITNRIAAPVMVTDITPTVLQMVEAAPTGGDVKPMTGRSLLPLLRGERPTVYADDDVRVIEVSGNSALYKGDYKITRNVAPVGDFQWRLYNLTEDPGETTDLGTVIPDKMQELLSAYDDYTDQVGVLPMPEGFDSYAQTISSGFEHLLENFWWVFVALAALILLALYGLWRLLRRLIGSRGASV